MTTKNNTKKFLSIIVIAIIGSMLFMACKAKPTDLNNYQVEEPAVNPTNPETPNPTNENSQKVEVKIDNNNDLRQFGEGTRENFKGYHYVSKEYMINGKPYKFTATVGWDSYQYYIQFEDGYKFYQGAGPSCKGANYKLVIQSGASRNGGACQYADVVFTTNGYLYVKFNNYSWTIEYALSKKEEVKDNTNDSEISKDGASIPEVFWGIYDVTVGVYAVVSPAIVNSNSVRYSNIYYIKDYIGNNTWYVGDQHGYSKIRNKFFRNEKGQRIFYEILEDGKYTNIFIHRDDK